MSVMRQATSVQEVASLRLRGESPLHRVACASPKDVAGEIVWRVRKGSLGNLMGSSLQQAASTLRGVHADADVSLVFVLCAGVLSCHLRSGGAKAGAGVFENVAATVDVCPQTGLAHVRATHDGAALLVATLRQTDGVWRAMYAQTSLLAQSGAGGGRYEVERE